MNNQQRFSLHFREKLCLANHPTMKRFLFATTAFIAMLSAIVLLFSCETKKEQEAVVITTEDSLQNVLTQKENELNDMVCTLNEIQEGFRKINEAQGRVSVESRKGETNQREAIIEDMRTIQTTMQLNNELISNLKQQLRTATASNSQLKATLESTISTMTAQMEELNSQIAALREELAKKDITIAEQDTQIGELKTNVSNLESENESRAKTISDQDKDLHTAYYVFGTKKELKNENILVGGDALQSETFNKDYFTKIDIRVDKVIRLYSKSATIKTTHPAGTYRLDKDSKGQYVLRITNPEKFWSVSKYLVIIVK